MENSKATAHSPRRGHRNSPSIWAGAPGIYLLTTTTSNYASFPSLNLLCQSDTYAGVRRDVEETKTAVTPLQLNGICSTPAGAARFALKHRLPAQQWLIAPIPRTGPSQARWR